jgi:hypothetical protein
MWIGAQFNRLFFNVVFIHINSKWSFIEYILSLFYMTSIFFPGNFTIYHSCIIKSTSKKNWSYFHDQLMTWEGQSSMSLRPVLIKDKTGLSAKCIFFYWQAKNKWTLKLFYPKKIFTAGNWVTGTLLLFCISIFLFN